MWMFSCPTSSPAFSPEDFLLYYPPIPFLQQVIAVLQGEWCLTLWNVSHVKTDRIMFESSLIEGLTADVWNYVSTLFDCLAEMTWSCEGAWERRGSKWSIKSDDQNMENTIYFFSFWTLFSTVLFLDTEVWPPHATPSVLPNFCAADKHEGGFVSRSHKEGANIKAYHIVMITGLQPAPLFHSFPGISVFNWT